jgi:ABC-type multidrug transport system ATPase subunit
LCRNIGIIDHGTIVENTSMKQLLGQLHVETFLLDLKNDCRAPQLIGYAGCSTTTPWRSGRQEHGHHCVVHSTGAAEHRSAEPA